MRALEILLAQVVDYAGLFPPAALDMPAAGAQLRRATARAPSGGCSAASSCRRRGSASSPTARVDARWRLTATTRWPVAGARRRRRGATRRASRRVDARTRCARVGALESCDAAELRALDAGRGALARRRRASASPPRPRSSRCRATPTTRALADAARGARAVALKLRTGGVTPDAFPTADVVAARSAACVARERPFKLTAGLHHPLRGEHPLTYEPGCPRGTMHGFLNVLAATALLAARARRRRRRRRCSTSATRRHRPRVRRWARGGAALRRPADGSTSRARAPRFASFGSCSFVEPVDGPARDRPAPLSAMRRVRYAPTGPTRIPSHSRRVTTR